jgi:hypothetical protein
MTMTENKPNPKRNRPESYNLQWGGCLTETYHVLHAAARGGTTVTRRAGGWSNFNIVEALMRRGWIEPRPTGPRGGKVYFATRKGRYHMRRAVGEPQ